MKHSNTHSFTKVYGFFHIPRAGLSGCNGDCMPTNLKYLQSSSLQEKFADTWPISPLYYLLPLKFDLILNIWWSMKKPSYPLWCWIYWQSPMLLKNKKNKKGERGKIPYYMVAMVLMKLYVITVNKCQWMDVSRVNKVSQYSSMLQRILHR